MTGGARDACKGAEEALAAVAEHGFVRVSVEDDRATVLPD